AVPLKASLPRAEVPYYLTDSGAFVAIVDPQQVSVFEELRNQAPALRHVITASADGSAGGLRLPSPAEGDPCLMIYSSRTTGCPRAPSTPTAPSPAPCWRSRTSGACRPTTASSTSCRSSTSTASASPPR